MKRFLLILGIAIVSTSHADVLTVPSATDEAPAATTFDRSQLPARGTNMNAVRNRFGEPASISGPIGNPPITRWTYDDFLVFFEYRHVINAVIPGKPAVIYNQDELRRSEQ
jgi:hypothetical protein